MFLANTCPFSEDTWGMAWGKARSVSHSFSVPLSLCYSNKQLPVSKCLLWVIGKFSGGRPWERDVGV